MQYFSIINYYFLIISSQDRNEYTKFSEILLY